MTFEEYLKDEITELTKEVKRLEREIKLESQKRNHFFSSALKYASSFDRSKFEKAFQLVESIKSLKMEDYTAPPLIPEKELRDLVDEFEHLDAVLVYYRDHCKSLKAERESLSLLKIELKENEMKLGLLLKTQQKLQGLNLLPELEKVPND